MYNRSLFIKPRVPPPPKRRYFRYIFVTAFKRLLMTFGALFLFSIVMGVALSLSFIQDDSLKPLPESFVLSLTLDQPLIEYQAVETFGLGPRQLVVRDIVDALDHARGDPRVKGLALRMQGGGVDLANIQELHAAIRRFRDSGRFAHIYAVSYGEPGAGLGAYYLASAFDRIWMQPQGIVSIAGIRAEMPFMRDLLDKIGAEPQFFARREYKNVFEGFTGKELSPESREMMQSLIDDIADNLIAGIAAAHGTTPDSVRALMRQGLYTDKEAVTAKLVTDLGDISAFESGLRKQLNVDNPAEDVFVTFDHYVSSKFYHKKAHAGPSAALVYVQGAIAGAHEVSHAAFYDDSYITADDIAADILDVADDEEIKAIVLRIDSPGGSPAAAETIRLAVVKAKEKGKKIIVSMGATAASGGYWVAAPADRIFALPGTLTGSIGVAGGKFSLAGLWGKIGVGWDHVQVGDNAGMWSFNEPFSAAGSARMNALMDNTYDSFIAHVAEGRKMTRVQADAVARGRVWSGRQALGKGLVDELGGLDAALDYTARELGAADRTHLALVVLPQPENPFEALFGIAESQVKIGRALSGLQAHLMNMTSGYMIPILQP